MGAATITNEDLLNAVQQLAQTNSDGFARLNIQLDGLDGHMDQLDERMERVEIRVDMLGVQLDRLEIRMDQLETRIDHLENQMNKVEQRLSEHDLQFAQIKTVLHSMEDKHAAYVNDIEDILDRIHVLETHMPDLTSQEFAELKDYLDDLSDWARRVAKITKVPLKST